MMFDRWRKLERALYVAKEKAFDISKIPDVYDSIKYDCIHNKHLAFDLSRARPPPAPPPLCMPPFPCIKCYAQLQWNTLFLPTRTTLPSATAWSCNAECRAGCR